MSPEYFRNKLILLCNSLIKSLEMVYSQDATWSVFNPSKEILLLQKEIDSNIRQAYDCLLGYVIDIYKKEEISSVYVIPVAIKDKQYICYVGYDKKQLFEITSSSLEEEFFEVFKNSNFLKKG